MKLKNTILLFLVLCLSVFTGCKKDDGPENPALKEVTNRTVLMYLFQDTNLVEELTNNINDLELGWVPGTEGTMLVYVDASTRMTQFGGKPVLLEITHDETNLIVSKVVKVYEDADATNAEVFRKVQEDAIAMYPAESYGLIIGGHGNGFFVKQNKKGLSGSDRWSNNFLDIDVIANNLPVHYDFIMFDACLMGETTTLYQLRKATDYVVASVELSPGSGFAYRSDLKALFAQPNADLYTFARETINYYQNTEEGKPELKELGYVTLGVYRMSAMENLAAVTKKVSTKLNLKYDDLRESVIKFTNYPNMKIASSMYYPSDKTYSLKPYYYDMGLLKLLLIEMEEQGLARELDNAIFDVVIQRQIAISEGFLKNNSNYYEFSANLSFFIPDDNNIYISGQSDAFYNRFEWSAAAGFTSNWK